MTAQLVGVVQDQTVPANTLLRVTFGEHNGIDYIGWFNNAFSSNFGSTYGKLAPLARVIPTTQPNLIPGDKVATIDAMNKVQRTASEMVRAIEAVCTTGVELRTVEVLSADKRAISQTDAGAQERAATREGEKQAADAASWLTKAGNAFGEGFSTLKWLALVAIIVIIVLERRGK